MKTQTRDALTAVLVAAQVAWATAAAAVPSASASRYAAIVIDAQTGGVLYERNADLPRQPASLTKIMTLYMTFEALSQKKIALTDNLPVSVQAASREPSRLGLTPGSTLKLEDAIRGMTTKSANDAASVVAEALGKGSEARFAEMMTARAKALGLKQTKFLNASGLPGQEHVSSARDLATLCLALVRDYPDYYRYFSTSAFEFKGKRYSNQNRFLRSYFGADGIKTGFVNASGHNLAASAVRGDKRLVAIVLGGDTQLWTREHATRLMDVAYAKIDPNLAFMASNAVNAAPVAVSTTTYATPAGAITVASATAAVASPTTNPAAAPTATDAAVPAATDAAEVVSPDAEPVAAEDKPTSLAGRLMAAVLGTTRDPEETDDDNHAQPAVVATATDSRPGSTTDSATATTARPDTTPAVVANAAPGTGPVSAPTAATAPVVAPKAKTDTSATPAVAAGGPKSTSPTPKNAAATPATETSPASPAPATAKPPVPATTPADHAGAAAPVPVAGAKPAPAKPARGEWAVQVGLFRDESVARKRAEEARDRMPTHLRGADLVVAGSGDGVHLASRLTKLSEQDAREACTQLQRGSVPCVVIPPGRPMIVATN